MPDCLVDVCVTSPPYFGLRKYVHDEYLAIHEIGLESSIAEYVEKLVTVFREVKRVLKREGTLWLNLGDCFNGSGGGNTRNQRGGNSGLNCNLDKELAKGSRPIRCHHLKSKDLIGIPWEVAFALRNDGWYLRSDIIWHKPSPMPESVKDRPTRAHEYVFLLSKSPRYY